jgi:hypothetical protein
MEFNLLEYTALVTRLIGIAHFIGSDRKSERQYGTRTLTEIIEPQMLRFDSVYDDSIPGYDEAFGPIEFFRKYQDYIGKGKYDIAANYAKDMASCLIRLNPTNEDQDEDEPYPDDECD